MKRSRIIHLTMLAGITTLSACDNQQIEGPSLVKDEKECIEKFQDPEGCHDLAVKAENDFNASAPKFDNRNDCESQFGAQCHKDNGTGTFLPFMAGYFISRAMNGTNQYTMQPACNNQGSLYTNGCGQVNSTHGGYMPMYSYFAGHYSNGSYIKNQRFSESWTSNKVAAVRINAGPSVIARGGFGTTAVGVAE